MKRYVAVVGTGYWGKNLVRVFHELEVLHAVCDVEPGRLNSLDIGDEVLRYSDLDEVLEDTAVRSVVVATPAATHFELCRSVLKAGRDAFVEKPLAMTVRQGQELVRLAEAGERILMVGHILRYHPAVVRLGEMIEAGDMGRVEYIYSNRLNMGKLRTEENILWSFAPHDISVILALLGEQPVLVSSHGEAFLQRNIFDVTLTSIEFPHGVKAHTFVSWLHPFKEQRLVVVGSEQMAVFEDTSPTEKLVMYPHRVQWHAGKIPVAVKGERQVVDIASGEPLKVECEHFLECCATRIPPRTDGYEGLAVLRVLNAAERSLRQAGEPVGLGMSGNGHKGPAGSPRVPDASHCTLDASGFTSRTRQDATALVTAPVKTAITLPRSPSPDPRAPIPRPLTPDTLPRSAVSGQRSAVSTDAFIHPTAVVDPGCEVGRGAKIWHYSHISQGARIGRNCVLGQNVFVADNVKVGNRCKVQNNVSLYKGVVLEDDVFCGPSCVFTNVIDPRAFVEKKAEFKDTVVRQGATIGANATVICGTTLGRYCLVGAGAVVTHDVPDHAMVLGVPARQAGWVCRCGERLAVNGKQGLCGKCGEEYRFENGTTVPTASLKKE